MEHDKKLKIALDMKMQGGSFAQSLAETWLLADPLNSLKIEEVFKELIERYDK